MQRKKRKWGLLFVIGMIGICVGLVFLSAIVNLFIPTNSTNTGELSTEDISRVLEADHLQQQLGEQVFPVFQSVNIPDLLFNEENVTQLAQQFLDHREQRRKNMQLSSALIRLENQREWVEGMARYAELETWRLANLGEKYEPLEDMQNDPKFKEYRTFNERWGRELDQIARMAANEGDGRFYYTGMAQAFLLDQLDPGWKTKLAADPSLNLEDLLEEALNNN